MHFETLALEIHSSMAGWEVIKPPRCTGISGVEHRFSFLASKRGELHGFDLCQDVGEVEVLKAFVKEMDTKANVFLVCLKGRPTEKGSALANEYGIKVLSPADIGSFFDTQIAEARAMVLPGPREGAPASS